MPKFTLMAHQTEAVKFLDSQDGIGALLFEPGVGKTGSTLAYIDLLASRQKEVRVLVVAPLTAADTWVLQAAPFMDSTVKARMLQGSTLSMLTKIAAARDWTTVPDAAIKSDHKGTTARQIAGNKVTILSMSAGALSSYCAGDNGRTNLVRMLRAIRKYAPHVIVLDESHIAKSATSNISKAMYSIGQLAPHRIILTGTVNPLNVLDCYGQWRFMAPWTFSDQYDEAFVKAPLEMTKAEMALIKPWAWGRFSKRYALPGGHKGKVMGAGGFQNEDELRDRVAERSMVVRKEDALDLPPTNDIDVHVALNARESKAYKQMAEDLAAEMEDGSLLEAVNVLSKLMKLRQIAAGFVKDTETGEVHVVGNSLQKAVKEIATVQLAGEQRLVVAGYFRSECAALAEMLRKAEPNTVVEVITGSTKAADRLAIRQRFGDVSGNLSPNNKKRMILVAQARTMSLSVNELVTAQHLITASLSERRDDFVQLRGRLDRNGQTKPVTFWNVYSPGLIGNIMLDRHKDRGDLEAALLNHIRSFVRR